MLSDVRPCSETEGMHILRQKANKPMPECEAILKSQENHKLFYLIIGNLIISKENSGKVVRGSRVCHRLELGRSV